MEIYVSKDDIVPATDGVFGKDRLKRRLGPAGLTETGGCVCRILDSAILVMKAAENWLGCDCSNALNSPMEGSILVQTPMGPQAVVIGGMHDDLLLQHEDLRLHCRARTEQVDHSRKNQTAEIQHPAEVIRFCVSRQPGGIYDKGQLFVRTDSVPALPGSIGFMEIEELSRRILFIGGGYISFEFTH